MFIVLLCRFVVCASYLVVITDCIDPRYIVAYQNGYIPISTRTETDLYAPFHRKVTLVMSIAYAAFAVIFCIAFTGFSVRRNKHRNLLD